MLPFFSQTQTVYALGQNISEEFKDEVAPSNITLSECSIGRRSYLVSNNFIKLTEAKYRIAVHMRNAHKICVIAQATIKRLSLTNEGTINTERYFTVNIENESKLMALFLLNLGNQLNVVEELVFNAGNWTEDQLYDYLLDNNVFPGVLDQEIEVSDGYRLYYLSKRAAV